MRNVDPVRRRLHVEESATEVDRVMVFGTPKTHQQRYLPIPKSLLDELVRACVGKGANELVFTAPMGGDLAA